MARPRSRSLDRTERLACPLTSSTEMPTFAARKSISSSTALGSRVWVPPVRMSSAVRSATPALSGASLKEPPRM